MAADVPLVTITPLDNAHGAAQDQCQNHGQPSRNPCRNHSGAQSGAEGQHRAHGQVNGIRQYDEGHAEGNESVNGRLAQQGQEIGPVRKLGLAMLMPATSRMRGDERSKILGVIDDFILIFHS